MALQHDNSESIASMQKKPQLMKQNDLNTYI